MDLDNIKFILDLTHTNTVNRYLQKGWVLIKTYTSSYDPEIAKDDLTMHYVVGATSDVDFSEELSRLTMYAGINDYFIEQSTKFTNESNDEEISF
ncbi:hypothetical protein [Caloramator australicus]|nr:hypothetical protein [Caloramator australicus]